MRELLDSFDELPGTAFILCDSCIIRRIIFRDLTGLVDGVLAEHKNHVFIDLSWVVYPNYILKNLDGWAALIRKYPDNFVIGSDAVGRFSDYSEQIRIYDLLFDAINDSELVEKLASRNFLRIMRSNGVDLDSDYRYPEDRYNRRPLTLK